MRPTRPTARRLVVGASLVAVLGVLSAAPALAASTPSPSPSSAPITFGIRPAGEGGDPRSGFLFRLEPGAEVSDAVSVFNYSESPLTLKLYAADAVTNSSGDVTLLPRDATSAIASWIGFSGPEASAMVVPARTRVDVPFTIDVPDDASPGDHIAGIGVVLPATTTDGNGNVVAVDSTVAVPLSIRVGGVPQARVEIRELAASYAGDWRPWATGTVRATYRVANTGNISQSLTQSLALAGIVGDPRVVDGAPVAALLPGDVVDVVVEVPDVWPLLRYDATATVVPAAAPGDPVADVVSASVSVWALPWPQLAVIALLVLLALLLRWWRGRGAPPKGRPVAEPTPELVESA